MVAVERQLGEQCRALGFSPIARASLYNALERVPMPRLARRQLPAAVQQALYNLVDLEGGVGSDEVPPTRPLEIQSCVVDVQPLASGRARSKVKRRARSPQTSSGKTSSSAPPAGRSRSR